MKKATLAIILFFAFSCSYEKGSGTIRTLANRSFFPALLLLQTLSNGNFPIQMDGNNAAMNDCAEGIAVDHSNSFYTVSNTRGFSEGYSSIWVKKFSTDGVEDLSWNKVIADGPRDFYATNVAIDSMDNVYVIGSKAIFFDSNAEQTNWLIKKFSSDGNEIVTGWNKTVVYPGYGASQARSIAIDASDNVIVAGNCTLTYNMYRAWCVNKYDSSGNLLWDRSFYPDSYVPELSDIAIDASNDLYIGGYGYSDATIQKIAGSDGLSYESPWPQSMGFSNDYEYADYVLTSLGTDREGNIYSTGTTNNFIMSGENNPWIQKQSSAGNEIWTIFQYTSSGRQINLALAVNSSNNVFVTGYLEKPAESSWILKKYSISGIEDFDHWDKSFNTGGIYATLPSMGKAIAIDGNDNVYVAGCVPRTPYSSDTDIAIHKFDRSGNEYR